MISPQHISFILGVIAGLLFLKKADSLFIKLLFIGYVLSLSLLFTHNKILQDISFWSFGILTFIFTINNIYRKEWVPVIIGFFIFLFFLWGLFYWPYYSDLQFLMLAPIIGFILIFINWKKNMGQLAIIFVLFGYEMNTIIELFIGLLSTSH